jgi:glucosyl-dolichyl phosphate glucuronosyltransferase
MNLSIAVSVIMSTYNRAHYLPDALKALAAQECNAPFEVILIDNASTDGTAAVFQDWCRKDSRFRTAHEPRLGLSYGKNAGIKMARAPLLLFTDDDMVTDPHWIESYRDLFERRETELMLAGGPYVPIPSDLGEWPSWFDEPALADVALLHYWEERMLRKSEYVWGGNMAVPARLFERFGQWDETVGRKGDERGTFEDTEFQDRIRRACGKVWFCPAAAVHHRVPRETLTPRQISSTAFTRGRNDPWMQNLPVWGDITAVPRRNAAAGLLMLATNLSSWGFWVIVFRLIRNKSCFERARSAAFASGSAFEWLRAGRNSMRLYRTTSRFTFLARRLVLRLTPDIP